MYLFSMCVQHGLVGIGSAIVFRSLMGLNCDIWEKPLPNIQKNVGRPLSEWLCDYELLSKRMINIAFDMLRLRQNGRHYPNQ